MILPLRITSPAMVLDAYEDSAKIPMMYRSSGGQALILHEIAAAFAGCRHIWLPFRGDAQLENHLYSQGFQTHCSEEKFLAGVDRKAIVSKAIEFAPLPAGVDAVYFGTPTIVNDEVLFRASTQYPDVWDAELERIVARAICRHAEKLGMRRIVSGLGTGDIGVHERIEDMGAGTGVVCWKRFQDAVTRTGFDDFVLVRELRG